MEISQCQKCGAKAWQLNEWDLKRKVDIFICTQSKTHRTVVKTKPPR